jgi:2-C-methyl-D-erythritol 4-phosphate cytidylyltransferase
VFDGVYFISRALQLQIIECKEWYCDLVFIFQAAGITRPLTSTVIAKDSDGFLSESLDRTKYLASEMPQGFHFDVINTAYKKVGIYYCGI